MITAAEVAWEAKAIFDHLLKYSMSDEIFFFEIRSKQGWKPINVLGYTRITRYYKEFFAQEEANRPIMHAPHQYQIE